MTSSSTATGLSEEQYSTGITTHSGRRQETHLIPGANFRDFANFLDPKSRRYTRSSTSQVSTEGFVTVVRLRNEPGKEHEKKTFRYDSHNGPDKFRNDHPRLDENSAEIVFMKGLPSSSWVTLLGARYRVDGEFFRSHLRFLQKKEHFELPGLPSETRNMLRIPFTTICNRNFPLAADVLRQERQQIRKRVKEHFNQLSAAGIASDSIIRNYAIFDESLIIVDQEINCCIHEKSGGWVALALMDFGRDLQHCPGAPWVETSSSRNAQKPLQITPLIRHQLWTSQLAHPSDSKTSLTGTTNVEQNIAFLPEDYGRSLNPAAMLADPFYSLSEVYLFAASSEKQFINITASHIDDALHSADQGQEFALSNLRYYKIVLNYHITRIRYVINQLEGSPDRTWPRLPDARTAADDDARKNLEELHNATGDSRALILRDYQTLLQMSQALSDRCTDGADSIVNQANLEEARRAIAQGQKVKRLTVLAFFFVPLSFVATFFGMNFSQFGQGDLDLWIFFVASVPVVTLSAVVLRWQAVLRLFSRKS